MEFHDSFENIENFLPDQVIRPSLNRLDKGVLSEAQNRLNILMGSSENEGVNKNLNLSGGNTPSGDPVAGLSSSESPPKLYTAIKELDEEENWKERVVVLTRQDHEEYVQYAQDILDDLIHTLPESHPFNSCENSFEDPVSHASPVNHNSTLDNSSLSDYESATDEDKLAELSFVDNRKVRHKENEQQSDLSTEISESIVNVPVSDRVHPANQSGNSFPDSKPESHLDHFDSNPGLESTVNVPREVPSGAVDNLSEFHVTPTDEATRDDSFNGQIVSDAYRVSPNTSNGSKLDETSADYCKSPILSVPEQAIESFYGKIPVDHRRNNIEKISVDGQTVSEGETSFYGETSGEVAQEKGEEFLKPEISDRNRRSDSDLPVIPSTAQLSPVRSVDNFNEQDSSVDGRLPIESSTISSGCNAKDSVQLSDEHRDIQNHYPDVITGNSENIKGVQDFITEKVDSVANEKRSVTASDIDLPKLNESFQNIDDQPASKEDLDGLSDHLLSFETPSKASIEEPPLPLNFEESVKSSFDNNKSGTSVTIGSTEEFPICASKDKSFVTERNYMDSPSETLKTVPDVVIKDSENFAEIKPAPGSYNIDFDLNFDPFSTRSKVCSSPPKGGSPRNDVIRDEAPAEEDLNPFVTRSNLCSSPPKSEPQAIAIPIDGMGMDSDIAVQVHNDNSVNKTTTDECLETASPSSYPDLPAEEKSEHVGSEVPVSPKGDCFDYDISFDPNFNPFDTNSKESTFSSTKDGVADERRDSNGQMVTHVTSKPLTIETNSSSFNCESGSVTPNNVTVIENENFLPPSENSSLNVANAEETPDRGFNRISTSGSFKNPESQDAREAEESSEDSGIQMSMPTKGESRTAEEPSNITPIKAQSNHLAHDAVTPVSDNSTVKEFSGLNINETECEQNQFSKNQNDIKDEDTSLKNQSEAGPDIAEFTEEEFKSAVEFFKDPAAFEFLQKAGNSKTLEQSTLARMSLYVKFDPLLKQDSPTRRASAQLQRDNARATNEEESDLSMEAPCKLIDFSPSPKKHNSGSDPDSQRIGEENVNMRMSTNKLKQIRELRKSDAKLFTEEEMNQALKMQELLYQEKLLKKDKQWIEKCKHASKERDQERAKVNSFHESQSQMTQIIAEYEKTIADLIAQKEADRLTMQNANDQLKKEKDQALEDFQGVETAFADLHRRYEKSKSLVGSFKKNEETFHETIEQYRQKLKKAEQKYELLKSHAESTLENANQEIMNVKKASESEIIVLQAQFKKSEMKIHSLERTVVEKTKEATELSSICDDLIQKVGHS